MATKYYLLKELAPREDGTPYAIATYNNVDKTFKVLFWETTEDKARTVHHRMVFGEADE